MPNIRGIIPPLVTPLLEQDRLDHAGLERLVEHTIRGGVHGLFVLGSTGEGASLSHRVRIEMVRETCKLAANRVPVFACATDPGYSDTIGFTRAAAAAGVSALLVPPPYYFLYTQEDLARYVEYLAAESPVPVLLYNIPIFTKVQYAPETVARLMQDPRIAGFKDSSGSIEYFEQIAAVAKQRADFALLIGPEDLLLASMRLGACGGICGGANLRPDLVVAVYEAALRGDWQAAERLQSALTEMDRLLYTIGDASTSYFRGLKAALHLAGICSDLTALPLSRFSRQESSALELRLKQAEATIDAALHGSAERVVKT